MTQLGGAGGDGRRRRAFLLDPARRELVKESAIDQAVVDERGYESITRPASGDQRQCKRVRRLGIPTWAIKEDSYFPGLLIAMYGPTGRKVSYQWKPRRQCRIARASSRNTPARRVKSAGSMCILGTRRRSSIPPQSCGSPKGSRRPIHYLSWYLRDLAHRRVQLALAPGPLGDWEDVLLKGRSVVICFDADARTNGNVLRAMVRFGRWLKSRGVKKVWYLVVPAEVNGTAVKGADDFFAAGGTLEELKAARTTTEPNPDVADDTFTDARLAETVADDVLADQFMWVTGLGWLVWDGRRWAAATEVEVTEAVRQYAFNRFGEAAEALRNGQASKEALDGWRSMLGAGRMRAVLTLARGIVERKADELDADPDLLNTPSGVVDLQTGELSQHDPALLMTKITGGSYRAGFTHPDWEKALEALPEPERDWLQRRIGQAITGHRTPDGVLPVLQGSGENGKSAITTDGVVPAVGGYASMASPKLLQFSKGSEHSTERAELRGERLLIAEELTEGRSIDVTALKQIQDVGTITARYVHKDNITFKASHSLFTTTNYVPIVTDLLGNLLLYA